ncbi:hypothetical protein AAVH_10972 [Aphelenchoides avenae]|nr:hypothetical protein AAVH_10972 [Aphelenchus avenae]
MSTYRQLWSLGTCGNISEPYDPSYYDINPAWYNDTDLRLQEQITMLEDYVERVPRSHWGLRAPRAGEHDVCLDDTGLVVKDFPGIRTCFSIWIYDYKHADPKHFAGRQIYNRVNQTLRWNIAAIGFDPSRGEPLVEPVSTESFSLAALFLKETCHVTNEPLENRCTYWITDVFYVSLCCCYTDRRECAYRKYKFPSQQKPGDSMMRACATGEYYPMKRYGGNHAPRNASEIASSVEEFVQERTLSEFCKWTYNCDPRDDTPPEDVLRVDFDAAKAETITDEVRSDGDLCNAGISYMNPRYKKRIEMFKKARPCEAHTAVEHLFWQITTYKKPSPNLTEGYMCPVFYNFAHPGRPNAFLQLKKSNNFWFVNKSDVELLREDGCHLVEVDIKEVANCSEKLFEEYDHLDIKRLIILLCAVEGNPLGESRASFPDAELKKTIAANLTAAKEAFPTCKTDFKPMDFESVSELALDSGKFERWMFDSVADGTNDDITTVHCYVEVSFVYQQQYNFTFGAVSIDDNPLRHACHASKSLRECVPRNSTADDEHQHFACCCPRHWSQWGNPCYSELLDQLTTLLNKNVIAKKSEEIMRELKNDPLTKCFEEKRTDEGQADTEINRPCARNDGCYAAVHARDVPTSTQHKEHGGCVSEYTPDAKKRHDSTSDEVKARFYRICRVPRNQDECFAVLGTEDVDLPDDVKGPQMVCCCGGRLGSAQKCDTSQQFGMRIGDFH